MLEGITRRTVLELSEELNIEARLGSGQVLDPGQGFAVFVGPQNANFSTVLL